MKRLLCLILGHRPRCQHRVNKDGTPKPGGFCGLACSRCSFCNRELYWAGGCFVVQNGNSGKSG
jgi:hypothetical protein